MRSVQQMRKAGRELPARLRHRLAVLRVAVELLHRPVPAPDRRPHQHVQQGHVDARRLGGLRHPRQPRARLQRAAAGGRLHHRLRRQVPQRVRVVAGPGAPAGACRAGRRSTPSSAPPTTAGTSPARPSSTSGCACVQHPAPPGEREQRRSRTRRTPAAVIGDLAMDFVTANEAADAPYFLEVALYAPHNRTNPEGHYAGDPLFPPMFRDRTGKRSCGRVACAQADRRRPARLRRPALGQPPAPGQRQARPGRGTPPAPCPPRQPSATCATARGWRSRPTGSCSGSSRSVGPNTYVVLTSDNGFHLGQNGLGRGKGTPYDTDVRVPLLVTGPGVVPGHAPGGHQQHRPRPDLRGARRARARALPQRPLARADLRRTRRWCGSPTPSSSTPSRR